MHFILALFKWSLGLFILIFIAVQLINKQSNMSVSTAAVGQEEKDIWMGGTSPMKVSYGKLMMWFFLLSDALTFSGLLVAYGTIRFSNRAFEG